MHFDLGAFAAGVLAAGAAAVGFYLTFRQLTLIRQEQQENEKWRRLELARHIIEKISTDEEIMFCTRALDWGVGPLVIPAKHRFLFPPDTASFEINWARLERAVKPDLDSNWADPDMLTYRYSFDYFFTYLESVSHYVGKLDKELAEVSGLDYYLDMIRSPRYGRRFGNDRANVFRPFLQLWFAKLEALIWPMKVNRSELGNTPSV